MLSGYCFSCFWSSLSRTSFCSGRSFYVILVAVVLAACLVCFSVFVSLAALPCCLHSGRVSV